MVTDVSPDAEQREAIEEEIGACAASCAGRDCGDDGCGGTCGICPGASLCNDLGQCEVLSCQSSKDCPGDLVCAQDLGLCVVCVGDEDCAQGETCGGDHDCHTELVCVSDKDCKAAGLVCDKAQGLCVECLSAAECDDDQHCQDSFCLDDLCSPGETFCSGGDVVACNDDGSAVETLQSCLETQYCEDAKCIDLLCLPDDVWCDGDLYKVCAEDGKSLKYMEDCAAKGQHCFGGACIDCVPECDGKDCGDDGCGGSCGACPAGAVCEGHSCVGPLPINTPGSILENSTYVGQLIPGWVQCAGWENTVAWDILQTNWIHSCAAAEGQEMRVQLLNELGGLVFDEIFPGFSASEMALNPNCDVHGYGVCGKLGSQERALFIFKPDQANGGCTGDDNASGAVRIANSTHGSNSLGQNYIFLGGKRHDGEFREHEYGNSETSEIRWLGGALWNGCSDDGRAVNHKIVIYLSVLD